MKKLIDPAECNNVCFSLVLGNEKRYTKRQVEKYYKQRLKRGFDDTEIFDLSYSLLRYLQPRFKRFIKDGTYGVPTSLCKQYNDNFDLAMREWKRRLKEIDWFIDEELENKEFAKIYKKYCRTVKCKSHLGEDAWKTELKDPSKEQEYLDLQVKIMERKEISGEYLKEHLFDLWS